MPLNFPHQPDVRLMRSPLTEVVCQVRFPPILRIGSEEPIAFQERVRRRFPRLESEQGFLFQLQFSDAGMTPPPAAQSTARLYRFRSVDGFTSITLANDFYALSTERYTVWEDFANDLALAHDSVQGVYEPGFSTRLGLRYVDQLAASRLGLEGFDGVVDLLRPELTSLLRVDAWTAAVEMLCQLLIPDHEGNLGLRFGTRIVDDERVFVLDFDYYDDRELPFEGLIERCHRFHDLIYDAFRWCIKDEKLDVFGPVPKGGD
jgi:uncharacterized protein (TIGR04255 family)